MRVLLANGNPTCEREITPPCNALQKGGRQETAYEMIEAPVASSFSLQTEIKLGRSGINKRPSETRRLLYCLSFPSQTKARGEDEAQS